MKRTTESVARINKVPNALKVPEVMASRPVTPDGIPSTHTGKKYQPTFKSK